MKDKPVILVVDDQPQNSDLLEAYLVPQNYEVVKAVNGEEALGKLSGNQIDLILLDVKMPGMDGFEVTRRVRQDTTHRLLPIILVTVLTETEDRIKGIEAGCDDFISIPVDKLELLARVRSLLKVKAYNDLMSNYRNELESEVTRRTEELKHALIFQQRLIDALPVPVFYVDLEDRYLGGNSSFEKIVGQKREEITGKSVYELFPKEIADLYHKQNLALLQNPGTQIYETTVKDSGGVVHNTLFHKATFCNMDGSVGGLIGAVLDITERKRSEEALRNSEHRLHTLVQTIPDLIWLKNKDGVYLSCNTMFERFFGAREADIVGKTDYDFVDRELAEAFREHDNRAMAEGKPTSNEEWINFADDGHRVFLETIKTPMYDAQGTLIGVLGIGRDITERNRSMERIKKALGATVQAIAVTVETRDPYTAGHQKRAAELAYAIATEMNLPIDMIEGIRMATAIHDLGKISVPAEILSKPTKLTDIEFSLIKTHAQSGYNILKDIDFPWPVARTILEHHERMNGSGYPNGLKGDTILMESRILAVADVVESMASHRPYRPALGIVEALDEIEKNKGTLYDKTVADACLRLFQENAFQF